mgnify:CR=1 FL=1
MSHLKPKHPISITIRRQSDSPVYVAGTFSDPSWEPFELTAKPLDSGKAFADGKSEYLFSREFELPEGQYEYRFREGKDGDWFVDDGAEHGKLGNELKPKKYES